jgi:Dienelactone hydrolase family
MTTIQQQHQQQQQRWKQRMMMHADSEVFVVRTKDDYDDDHDENNHDHDPPIPIILRDWSLFDRETAILLSQSESVHVGGGGDDDSVSPQFAKDDDYANAIYHAWEKHENGSDIHDTVCEWKSIQYHSIEPSSLPRNESNIVSSSSHPMPPQQLQTIQQVPLYGHFVRRRKQPPSRDPMTMTQNSTIGIVLFHTGAGPHDLFLLWKAYTLVTTLFTKDKEHVNMIVMIADILSDSHGWGWNPINRTHYQQTIQHVMMNSKKDDHNDHTNTRKQLLPQQRPILQCRIQAAIQALQHELASLTSSFHTSHDIVHDMSSSSNIQLAALGWCLGGQCILELSKMKQYHIKAMISYHGVFYDDNFDIINDDSDDSDDNDNHNDNQNDDIITSAVIRDNKAKKKITEILLCHGNEDPFVSNQSLQTALYVCIFILI